MFLCEDAVGEVASTPAADVRAGVNQGIIGCMNEVEPVLLSEQSVPKIQFNGKIASKMPKKAVWIWNEGGQASGGEGVEWLKQERLP